MSLMPTSIKWCILYSNGVVVYCTVTLWLYAVKVWLSGTGKSQFLKYVAKVMPRSLLTTGIGSTSAGLTVAAVKVNNYDCIIFLNHG